MSDSESEPGTSGEVDPTEHTDTAAHVVEFKLGEEMCAMDIDSVDSIVESKQITRVPRAPEAVEGVMDLRGETTAVVEPREFLSIQGGGNEENILVLDRNDDKQKIGIRVNEVTEVADYPGTRVDRNGELGGIGSSAIADKLVKGVIRKPLGEIDDDGVPEDVQLIMWLDIDALISAVDEAGEDRLDGENQI